MQNLAIIILLSVLSLNLIFAQQKIPKRLTFGEANRNVFLKENETHIYPLTLTKGKEYLFDIFQKGIDVELKLDNAKNVEVYKKDSPNGKNGAENFSYIPKESGKYTLNVIPFKEEGNAQEGHYDIYVKRFTNADIKLREKNKRELVPENAKTVQTAEIDHFWEAYDKLKKCKTHQDSVDVFQKTYINRATDGFIDFLRVREFTAEEYVNKLAKESDACLKVRTQMYEVKKAEPLIQEVFDKFKVIYPNFKPFKVCFAVGTFRTGGTVSNNFVLIGTEMVVSAKPENIPQRIKGIIAHECVHTQQKDPDSTSRKCQLLYMCLNEGAANFISEVITGNKPSDEYNQYGIQNEATLWEEFQTEMCGEDARKWLYNGFSIKDRPADLGYFIGYVIAKKYYENAVDKKQAIIDIIEMKDPMLFLEKSGYGK